MKNRITYFLSLLFAFLFSACEKESDFSGVEPVSYRITAKIEELPAEVKGKYRVYFRDRELGNETYFTDKDPRNGTISVFYDPLENGTVSPVEDLERVFETEFLAEGERDTVDLLYYRGGIMAYERGKFTRSGFKVLLSDGTPSEAYRITFNDLEFKPGIMEPFLLDDLSGDLTVRDADGNVVFQDKVTLPKNTEFTLMQVGTDYISLNIEEPEPADNRTMKFRMVYFGGEGSILNEDSYILRYYVTNSNTADYTDPEFVSDEITLEKGAFTQFYTISMPDGRAPDVIFLKVKKLDGTEVIPLENWWTIFPESSDGTGFDCKFQSFDIGGDYVNAFQSVYW